MVLETNLIAQTRPVKGYQPKPIICNEDDHFNFDQPENNFLATTKSKRAFFGLLKQITKKKVMK